MKNIKETYTDPSNSLGLRAGDWAEVRSQDEILATLDKRGCLDNLPFMPEMLRYCGKKFLVDKRADKTCDTITGNHVLRRMKNAVHLANVRCEGDAHGECDTTCMIFWKEAWLKRADREGTVRESPRSVDSDPSEVVYPNLGCSVENLYKATKVEAGNSGDEDIYSCQATELLRATGDLPWWDIRHYWRDLASGNINISEFIRFVSIAIVNWMSVKIKGFRVYPFFDKRMMVKHSTPREILDLQPGEIVQVKSISEILKTLDERGKNRGLYYDMNGEMLKYCDKKAKVLKRVRKVINERTGKLLVMKNESVILEGVTCCAHYSPNRLFCPRALYSFWREIWLKRVDS